MVNYFGYCPSLRKKVDFEVSEVVDIPTKRGMKYQIKGTYEGRLCNTFCSAETAQELRSQIGSPQVFTIMEAEESQENLGQATQEESVPAIIGPSQKAYGQEGESAQELPLAETVPTPIIDADGIGIEPIDDLSLPDATMADMQETLDEPPVMDANFEIAEMQPEGDGSSIGNIAPMNPDAPLHAEDFESEEGMANLGQATQEESVPAIIGPSEEAYGQQGESAQELPLAETVPTPIIDADGIGIEPIDNLSSFNGGDILSQMESQLGERPDILADFAIRPIEPFGDGRSIGNITPTNPDVPFASEDDDDDDDYEDDFDAETFDPLTVEEIEVMAQVPPPVCFEEKIPPSVWENTSIQAQEEYAETGNESVLICPQCGISKADLREQGGYCGTTDPESEEYISTRSCPYEKYFSPQHWIDEPQVISHITPEKIVLEDTLTTEMDMPPIDPLPAGIETRFIPNKMFYQINQFLPKGVVSKQSLDGQSYELTYYSYDTDAVEKVIDTQAEQEGDMMFGAETFEADSEYEDEWDGVEWCEHHGYEPHEVDWVKNVRIDTFKCPTCGMLRDELEILDEDVWAYAQRMGYDEIKEFGVQNNGEMASPYQFHNGDMNDIIEIPFIYDERYRNEAETFEAESNKKPSKTAEKAILTGASTGATMEIADALLAAEEDEEEEVWEYHVYVDSDGDLAIIHDARDFETKEDAIKAAHEVSKDERGKGKEVYVIAELRVYDEDGDWIDSYEESIYKIEADGGGDETNDSNVGGITFAEWIMYNKPELYFSLLDEKNSPNMVGVGIDKARSMDFAEWMMNNKPELYFSLIDERKEGFGAETFEADTRKYLGVWVNKQGDKHYYLYSDDDDYVFGELRYEPNWKANGWEHPYWDLDIRGGKSLFVKSFNEGVKAFRRETMNAEEFNVEFDDWADQEMLTHGENVSFKEWAKEEGKKHGDMDLTDWAEEEEESHDERYGAEEVAIAVEKTSGGDTLYGIEYLDLGYEHTEWFMSKTDRDLHLDMYVEGVYSHTHHNSAENFESQSAQTKVKPPVKSIGILLGLGAMAAVFAPESLKKLFNK